METGDEVIDDFIDAFFKSGVEPPDGIIVDGTGINIAQFNFVITEFLTIGLCKIESDAFHVIVKKVVLF